MESYVRQHLHEHLGKVRGYAVTLTRSHDLADDLVQNVCLRAIKSEHTFIEGNLLAWLLTITHNEYVTQVLRWKRTPTLVDLTECNVSYDAKHDVGLWIEDVGNMLASLPAEMQEAMRLCVIQGLTYDEAAAITGTPDGTVRSRLFRSRGELRKWKESDHV